MSEAKHTPGPWRVIDLDSPFIFGVGRDMTPDEKNYAEQHGRFDNPPMSILGVSHEGLAGVSGKEDAHLIAAAPDLLEALKVARDVGGLSGRAAIRSCGTCERCGSMTPSGTLKVCRKCASLQIESAIAKAEGRPDEP